MSIRYVHKITSHKLDRYDAKVGHLFVGAQDNGEGWFNWWVALVEQGPAAGDRGVLDAGGASSWVKAQELIEQAIWHLVNAIQRDS